MSAALAALRARGMLAAATHQDAGTAIDKLVRAQAASSAPVSVYCGFDPTAESLHLGNLLQGIALRHFQRAGLRPILLVRAAAVSCKVRLLRLLLLDVLTTHWRVAGRRCDRHDRRPERQVGGARAAHGRYRGAQRAADDQRPLASAGL